MLPSNLAQIVQVIIIVVPMKETAIGLLDKEKERHVALKNKIFNCGYRWGRHW